VTAADARPDQVRPRIAARAAVGANPTSDGTVLAGASAASTFAATLNGGLRPVAAPRPAAGSPTTAAIDAALVAVAVAGPSSASSPMPATRPFVRATPAPATANSGTRDAEEIADAAEAPVGVVQVAAAATAAPRIPTTTSVGKAATVQNALNLRRLNLIGVYGAASNRRALVRLPSGKFQKVKVGDRVDGGRVAAIDGNALRYIKGGRNVVLEMPRDG
jgi:hypothetical protein